MQLCNIFSKLTIKKSDKLFDEIIGYEDIKKMFTMALQADQPVSILLSGPPASAKTLFLQCLMKLQNSYFVDGSFTTKADTYEQFYEITTRLLTGQKYNVDEEIAQSISDAVWTRMKSANIRDCIRIGLIAKSVEDVNFIVDTFSKV